MYRAIDAGPDSVLLVEEQHERVVGFISGGVGMGPIYRRMCRHPLQLGWTLLPSLLRPARLKRILDILRYGRKEDAYQAALPAAELLSIAVDPALRGQGTAARLYRRLQAHFRARGIDAFKITVGDALVPAHRFYTRMGAVPVTRVEVHAGEGSVVYAQPLP